MMSSQSSWIMHYGNYTDTANDWVNKTLAGVSTGLSMVGVSIIILTYLFIKEIRTLSRHIIVCISVADLVTCLSNVSGLLITPDATVSSLECKVQSFVGTTAVLSSFLWTMMLAVYLYVIIVKQMHSLGRRIIIPYSHVLCWCLPLAINIIAISFGALGNDEDNTSSGWCWISLYKGNIILDDIRLARLVRITRIVAYLTRVNTIIHWRCRSFPLNEI